MDTSAVPNASAVEGVINPSLKPLTLYSHTSAPNPWKVTIILTELHVPFETKYMDYAELKKPDYEKINPNGRVPAIQDPNTNITLWETGAIIEYLIDTYDKANQLTYATFPEKYLLKQWLFFQTSGQGPYFGQAMWFAHFHPEKLPSAIARYKEQTLRVVDVLNRALEGKSYLVGNKCTYADLAFLTWDAMIPRIFHDEGDLQLEKKYPNYARWIKLCKDRKAVRKVFEQREKLIEAEKH